LKFAVAPTPLGAMGILWGDAGIAQTWLHAGTVERARAQIRGACPGAAEATPPAGVATALEDVAALLDGQPRSLSSAALDMAAIPDFDRRVYEVARTIPPGKTLTYGDIAHRLGQPGSAQAVGQAMGHNPFPIIVPCHRVLAAGGKDGGFSARGGVGTKRRMLVIEGALADEPTLF